MNLSWLQIGYVITILGVGSYVLVRTLVFLRSTRRTRIQGIEKRRRFEAVRTESPIKDPKTVARERGIESIETHFSVMQRLLVPIIVITTILLAVVPFIGGTTASIVAAASAVLLGLSVRPFLENIFAGLVICSSRLVRIGDTVLIDDCYGTIEDITATHTAVKVWDWRRYLVPNARMLQSAFFNYSVFDTFQWAYVEFWLAPDVDLDEVKKFAVQIPTRSNYFWHTEEPAFWVMGIEKDAIRCWLAAWADTPSHAWALANDIRTELLRECRQRGICLSLQRHQWACEHTHNKQHSPLGESVLSFPPEPPFDSSRNQYSASQEQLSSSPQGGLSVSS